MIVDGRMLAEVVYSDVRARVAFLKHPVRLGIVTCAPNFETEKYLEIKIKKAREVGIKVEVVTLQETASTEEVIDALKKLVPETDGVVVQLPLPSHIDTDAVLNALPSSHDVDVLKKETNEVLSPVVGALKTILDTCCVTPKEKFVTVIGSGRLVGLPAYNWFQTQGAFVSVVTKDTSDISHYTKNADIIVAGAGVPNLITPDMVKEGVVILDAGTSEEGGMLKGDAHPDCASKSSIFTPVPGGIGPLTIAVLLRNVVELAETKMSVV